MCPNVLSPHCSAASGSLFEYFVKYRPAKTAAAMVATSAMAESVAYTQLHAAFFLLGTNLPRRRALHSQTIRRVSFSTPASSSRLLDTHVGRRPRLDYGRVITTRRLLYLLAAMVILLVAGTIVGLIWADTSNAAGAFAGVTNVISIVGIVLLLIALAVKRRRRPS